MVGGVLGEDDQGRVLEDESRGFEFQEQLQGRFLAWKWKLRIDKTADSNAGRLLGVGQSLRSMRRSSGSRVMGMPLISVKIGGDGLWRLVSNWETTSSTRPNGTSQASNEGRLRHHRILDSSIFISQEILVRCTSTEAVRDRCVLLRSVSRNPKIRKSKKICQSSHLSSRARWFRSVHGQNFRPSTPPDTMKRACRTRSDLTSRLNAVLRYICVRR